MKLDLNGRTALATGSTSGIGAAEGVATLVEQLPDGGVVTAIIP
ncbi:hypothetical protein ABZU76_28765 [Amycolatopsis sp. NPDC005232]